jgi:hypothetical protein
MVRVFRPPAPARVGLTIRFLGRVVGRTLRDPAGDPYFPGGWHISMTGLSTRPFWGAPAI